MGRRELAALLALAALWGASFLFIRVAAPALGPFPLMEGRVVLAAGLLWGLAKVRGVQVVLRPYWGRLLLLGLVHAAAPFALIAAAEVRLTASMAALLLSVQPLLTALVAARYGERLTSARVAGLLLGLVGVALLVGWSPVGLDRATLASSAAVLLAALCYASGSVYSRRRLAGAPVLTLALGQQLAAAAWLALPALATLPRHAVAPSAVAALVGLAVLSTAVAYQLFFWLIARVGPIGASTVTYLIPLFGLAWGALLLHEPVSRGMVLGLACILGSLGLAGRRLRPSGPLPSEPSAVAVVVRTRSPVPASADGS
ncbi:MAG: DMT family transporter [Holophagales bacterium]|nr:MAG: DMT family transporter [Holophagales bacterium]